MYQVCYEVMFMPVVMNFDKLEDAEVMKKKVEQKFPNIKVEIKG